MHDDKHNDRIYTQKMGPTFIFTRKKEMKIPVHSVKSGEPFSINFNGQKSNRLSYQSKIIYTDLLEVWK